MSASGDDVEDSTEYSRYGIKDAPQTAIATPLGQVSARFLQNLQGVGLSFQIWTSARDRNVIYGIIIFLLFVCTRIFSL